MIFNLYFYIIVSKLLVILPIFIFQLNITSGFIFQIKLNTDTGVYLEMQAVSSEFCEISK